LADLVAKVIASGLESVGDADQCEYTVYEPAVTGQLQLAYGV
jgi:hypothetical protein